MRGTLSTLLTMVLVIGSLFALVLSDSLRDGPAIAFGSPSAVNAVRAYYAAINHYIETGEIDAVHEIAGSGASGSGCVPAPLLPALRLTYPHLHITVDDLIREGSTVVAQVSVDAGPARSFGPVALPSMEQWRMTEIFTVQDGRLASCATAGPGLGLAASTQHLSGVSSVPGVLVVARISFASGSRDYLSIPAPAVLSIERGTLTTPGNGVSVLSDATSQRSETTMPGETYRLVPGDELAISAGRVVIHHADAQSASMLVTMIARDAINVPEALVSSRDQRLFELLGSPHGGKMGAGISVRTLNSGTEPVETGRVELMTASIVATAGGSATVDIGAADTVIVSLIGNPVIERNGDDLTIRNLGDDLVVVRFAVSSQQSAVSSLARA